MLGVYDDVCAACLVIFLTCCKFIMQRSVFARVYKMLGRSKYEFLIRIIMIRYELIGTRACESLSSVDDRLQSTLPLHGVVG